jgi:hypothetical protein
MRSTETIEVKNNNFGFLITKGKTFRTITTIPIITFDNVILKPHLYSYFYPFYN